MKLDQFVELVEDSMMYFAEKSESLKDNSDPDVRAIAEYYEACWSDYTCMLKWLHELQNWRQLESIIIPKHREGTDEYDRGANDMLEEILERIHEIGGGDTDENDT